jgi:hypothetical protein
MSRGPGRVQKLIHGLIASDPHGAWSVTQLRKHIYPDAPIEKKHRVAVNPRVTQDGAALSQPAGSNPSSRRPHRKTRRSRHSRPDPLDGARSGDLARHPDPL